MDLQFNWILSLILYSFLARLLRFLARILIVDAIFGPVTWHDQRRPLCPRHDLQNKKGPPGVGRLSLLRRSSQSNISYREERKREWSKTLPKWFFVLPFYTPMCYMSVLPLSSTRSHVDVWYLLWLDLTGLINIGGFRRPYWRLPATKVWGSGTNPFRGSKSHLEGKSGPTLGRGGIFLNTYPPILLSLA